LSFQFWVQWGIIMLPTSSKIVAFSTSPVSFIFNFILKRKEVNLGNNPEMGYNTFNVSNISLFDVGEDSR